MEAALTTSGIAGEAYGLFERRTRDDGEEFTTLDSDTAPGWLRGLVREAHGDLLPDDWRYEAIRDALGDIELADGRDLDDLEHEFADRVDVYTGALLAWLASHSSRVGYCDGAQSEGLTPDNPDVVSLIRLGQYMERREVFASVAQSLAERLEELEGEES